MEARNPHLETALYGRLGPQVNFWIRHCEFHYQCWVIIVKFEKSELTPEY